MKKSCAFDDVTATKNGLDEILEQSFARHTGRMVLWRALAAIGLTVLAMAPALGADPAEILVEDWSRVMPGARGIPDGWTGQTWGTPRYDFTVVTDATGHVMHLRSRDDNSTISKEVRVDVRRFPILTWRWKMVTLPRGGDARRRETDDQAGQLYVAFPRFPTTLRSRVIGYVWDTTAPAGTVTRSPSVGAVTYVVVRSGGDDVGRWVTETRDVYADYRAIYGEEPTEEIRVMSVAIDSNDTRSSAEAYMGAIRFRMR